METALPTRREDEQTPVLGMVVALASFAMLFAALFLSYAILRAQHPIWPPVGSPSLPLGLAAANTVVLLASSVALVWGGRQLRADRLDRFAMAVWLAFGLGAGFLLLQFRLWQVTQANGLGLSGIFGSVFYTLTWAHALHIVGGVVALLWLGWGASRRRFSASRQVPFRLVSLFWHFLDVVWGCMFLSIFVL